jgi:hypothetical protein
VRVDSPLAAAPVVVSDFGIVDRSLHLFPGPGQSAVSLLALLAGDDVGTVRIEILARDAAGGPGAPVAVVAELGPGESRVGELSGEVMVTVRPDSAGAILDTSGSIHARPCRLDLAAGITTTTYPVDAEALRCFGLLGLLGEEVGAVQTLDPETGRFESCAPGPGSAVGRDFPVSPTIGLRVYMRASRSVVPAQCP